MIKSLIGMLLLPACLLAQFPGGIVHSDGSQLTGVVYVSDDHQFTFISEDGTRLNVTPDSVAQFYYHTGNTNASERSVAYRSLQVAADERIFLKVLPKQDGRLFTDPRNDNLYLRLQENEAPILIPPGRDDREKIVDTYLSQNDFPRRTGRLWEGKMMTAKRLLRAAQLGADRFRYQGIRYTARVSSIATESKRFPYRLMTTL